jgi:mono/diheme cytochrome c family protein
MRLPIRKRLVAYQILLTLALASCGGNGAGSTESVGPIVGDALQGEEQYKRTVIGAASAPGCITCHSLEAGVTLVGPSHAGIGARAGSVVAGKSAEEYLKESIIDVDAHITEGFNKGGMYANYGRDLTEQQVADLVAFLLTLR